MFQLCPVMKRNAPLPRITGGHHHTLCGYEAKSEDNSSGPPPTPSRSGRGLDSSPPRFGQGEPLPQRPVIVTNSRDMGIIRAGFAYYHEVAFATPSSRKPAGSLSAANLFGLFQALPSGRLPEVFCAQTTVLIVVFVNFGMNRATISINGFALARKLGGCWHKGLPLPETARSDTGLPILSHQPPIAAAILSLWRNCSGLLTFLLTFSPSPAAWERGLGGEGGRVTLWQ